MQTVDERLAAIEKENRKLKAAVGLMLLLAVLIAWRGGPLERFKKLVAEELSLRAADGREFCSIRVVRPGEPNAGRPVLDMMCRDTEGFIRGMARITMLDDGGIFEVSGFPAKPPLSMNATAYLYATERHGAYVAAKHRTAEVKLSNPSDGGPRLLVTDEQERLRGGIGVGLTGAEGDTMSIALIDPQGTSFSIRDDGRVAGGIESRWPLAEPAPPPSEPTDSGATPTPSSTKAILEQSEAVGSAEKSMLKIAKRQGKSEGEIVERLVQQVHSSKDLAEVGWRVLDDQINKDFISAETRQAYQQWKSTVVQVSPPLHTIQSVRRTTSTKPEFSSPEALRAKVNLLNVAAQMGPMDKRMVDIAIEHVESRNQGWTISDHMLQGTTFEVRDAYRQWKAAVVSAP